MQQVSFPGMEPRIIDYVKTGLENGKTAAKTSGAFINNTITGFKNYGTFGDISFKGLNVGNGITNTSTYLLEVATKPGASSFTTKIATAGNALLTGMAGVPKVVPGVAAGLEALMQIPTVYNTYKDEGFTRGTAQLADSSVTVAGAAVGATAGWAAGGIIAAACLTNPIGWAGLAIGAVAMGVGTLVGTKAGDILGDGVKGFVNGIFGTNEKPKQEIQAQTQQQVSTPANNPYQGFDLSKVDPEMLKLYGHYFPAQN
ncbi:MAG TPA: hypothetical protein P5556_07605 [Candidatus Gastranaerophilales bacterium]|nr:hypothetical protein [Candidatus Gastranaerophilales bacterium]